jgi:hypothetical protein
LDHDSASQLLSDLLAHRLTGEEAAAVQAHVDSCSACMEVWTAMRSVKADIGREDAALFDEHPAAEHLVAYAAGDRDLRIPDLARLGDHVRLCPPCAQEVRVTRKALGSKRPLRIPGLSDAVAIPHVGRSFGRMPALSWAAFAVAILAVGYLELVRVPAIRRGETEARTEARSLRERTAEIESSLQAALSRLRATENWSGGFALLVLSTPLRDAEVKLPEIQIASGQPIQPILVDADLSIDAEDSIQAELVRQPDGARVWSHATQFREMWDPAQKTVNLLVPARALTPGVYRLDIHRSGAAEPAFSSSFRVRPTP